MSLGKEYEEGNVLFDPLTVMGKDFIISDSFNTRYFDYAYSVEAALSKEKRKKGDPERYNYFWGGHINLGLEVKLHLHNLEPDPGLVQQEAKLTTLKDTIDEFVKEFKVRLKAIGKKDLHVKRWLNPPDTRYTSYVAYSLLKDGEGSISISDCHRSNVDWVYIFRDDNGKVRSHSNKVIQSLEELSKGLGKSIKAIQQLRKFFEREVFDVSEK